MLSMKIVLVLGLLLVQAVTASATVVTLTRDNYEKETAGKSVFIKFYAPWCGACKKLAPDWEKLSSHFSASPTQLIAQVDCSDSSPKGGKKLCDAQKISGFPTLKYGNSGGDIKEELQGYAGSRGYDDLRRFSERYLRPTCSVAHSEFCDAETLATITRLESMSLEELEHALEAKELQIQVAEADFQGNVQKLQDNYVEIKTRKEKKTQEFRDMGLVMMKNVLKAMDVMNTATGGDEL